MLSKALRRVLVLERHYTAGGFTHSFSRNGFEWNVGVHYIGDLRDPDMPLRRLFDFISEGRLQWADMGEVYDRIDVGNGLIDFHAGEQTFKAALCEHFPDQVKKLTRYLKKIREGERDIARVVVPRLMPQFLSPLLNPLSTLAGVGAFGTTTADTLQALDLSPELASVLCGQWGDYGLPPALSAFGIHALIARHYMDGACYPVGGASMMARSIIPTIEAAGGSVVVRAEVAQILIENGISTGVVMADGREIRTPKVFSGCGINTTATQLLPQEQRVQLFPQFQQIPPSIAHLGLYVGLEGSAAALDLQRANLWLHAGPDHDRNYQDHLQRADAPFPFVYISFPSAKDPSWDERYPKRSTIDIITTAPYERFHLWAQKPWRKRGSDYQEYKQQLSERLLERMYQALPQLRGKVKYHELSTPLSTSTFSNQAAGQFYGMAHNPQRFQQKWVRPNTALRGFYLTGQDVITCGVGGAAFSGVATFSRAVQGLECLRVLKNTFA